MMPKIALASLMLPLTMCAVLAPADALGAPVQRSFVQNASGTCQAALPSFEGLVRKRPLALQNESGSTAFVSCSLVGTHFGPGYSARVVDIVFAGLINNTDASIEVTCTLVDGLAKLTPSTFIPQTAIVPANGWVELSWDAADNGGSRFVFSANVQCALPFGTGISYTASLYDEEIGS